MKLVDSIKDRSSSIRLALLYFPIPYSPKLFFLIRFNKYPVCSLPDATSPIGRHVLLFSEIPHGSPCNGWYGEGHYRRRQDIRAPDQDQIEGYRFLMLSLVRSNVSWILFS